MKTMEMNEVSPDIYDKGYMYQFQPEAAYKIH